MKNASWSTDKRQSYYQSKWFTSSFHCLRGVGDGKWICQKWRQKSCYNLISDKFKLQYLCQGGPYCFWLHCFYNLTWLLNNNYMIWCCVHVIKVLCWVIYQCFNKALLAGNIFQKVKKRPSIKTWAVLI